MPLFNLPFTLDDDERRRRLAEQAMTTGAFPRGVTPIIPEDAPPPVRLPDVPAPSGRMLPSPGIPGEIPDGPMMGAPSPLPESPGPRGMMAPSPGIPGGEKYGIPGVRASRPPTRYDELAEMKGAYMSGAPGRGKSALTGAMEGFMGGGGLAGAATGAAYGAIDPRRLRERQFERYERPGILERFAFEDADTQRRRQAEKDALNEEYRRAQTEHLKSEAYKNRLPPPAKEPPSHWVQTDQGWVDLNAPENRGKTFRPYTAPKEERQPTAAELATEPESGKSVEEIAEDSYQARGGDNYVFSKLPAYTRQLLSGEVKDADPQEVARAQSAFDAAIERQRKADLNYTRGSVRSRRLNAGRGGKPTGSQSGISRPRSQFNSKLFPGLKFD